MEQALAAPQWLHRDAVLAALEAFGTRLVEEARAESLKEDAVPLWVEQLLQRAAGRATAMGCQSSSCEEVRTSKGAMHATQHDTTQQQGRLSDIILYNIIQCCTFTSLGKTWVDLGALKPTVTSTYNSTRDALPATTITLWSINHASAVRR